MELTLPNFSPDSTLTAAQHLALAHLADGRSLAQAAEACGVHRNTIRNWRRTLPAFARDCDLALREQAAAWHEFAIELAPRATEILRSLLHNEDTPKHLQLRAALAILKMAADPHPKPLPLDLTVGSELSAINGFAMRDRAIPRPKTEQPCTIVHNALMHKDAKPEPIRRAPEPGRNTPCPCGSLLKYKRCCGSGIAPVAPQTHAQSTAQSCTTAA